jgi:hypothetical protein
VVPPIPLQNIKKVRTFARSGWQGRATFCVSSTIRSDSRKGDRGSPNGS